MSWLRFRISGTSVIAPSRLDAFSQLSRLENTKQVSLLKVSLIHTKSWQPPVMCLFFSWTLGVFFSFSSWGPYLVFEETHLRVPILPCSCSPIQDNHYYFFFSCSYPKWLIILQGLGFTFLVLRSFIRVLCLLAGLLGMYSQCLPTSWPWKSSNNGVLMYFLCSILIKRKSAKILGVHTMVIS